MTAPVTAIIAYDLLFYEKLPKLFPHNPAMRNLFATNPQLVETTARRNSTLQGAYFMLAGRECQGCDQEFFPEGHVRSNFLCNVGYGDPSKLMPRLPRPDFSESCSLL
jgi:3-hydroxypropanoate dehydrogenase